MADSSITKAALGAALKRLVSEKPFEKISIADICDLCNMNRKSFYYHFHDKYELVIWIFENEYISSVKGTSYSISESLTLLCRYFYENRSFYKKILKVYGQNCFTDYFAKICRERFVLIAKGKLTGLTATDKKLVQCADFFVFAVYSWITSSDSRDDAQFVSDIKDMILFGGEIASLLSEAENKE